MGHGSVWALSAVYAIGLTTFAKPAEKMAAGVFIS